MSERFRPIGPSRYGFFGKWTGDAIASDVNWLQSARMKELTRFGCVAAAVMMCGAARAQAPTQAALPFVLKEVGPGVYAAIDGPERKAFSNAGWVLYAYYMWSAIVGLVLVAQFWTFANEMFTPREGKRLFGLITAGGTLGGMAGGILANWAVSFLVGTNQLLWFIVALLAGAYGVAYRSLTKGEALLVNPAKAGSTKETGVQDLSGVVGTVFGSGYLQTIGAVIFISVVF